MAIYKPQVPIEDLNGNKVLPITSVDQVIMPDTRRLSAVIDDCATIDDLGTQVIYQLNGTKLLITPIGAAANTDALLPAEGVQF